jgi:hypothetical protein
MLKDRKLELETLLVSGLFCFGNQHHTCLMCFYSRQTKKAFELINRYNARIVNELQFEMANEYNGFTHNLKGFIQDKRCNIIIKKPGK